MSTFESAAALDEKHHEADERLAQHHCIGIASIAGCRVNIRLSSADLGDIQTKALQEGVPYQTLITSVLHKHVSGRFVEKSERIIRSTRTSGKRAAG